MRRFMKGLHRGEKGFTLIELLIVVAILGILAVVVVPNLAGFLTTGQVAAANTEVANAETAALAYYADNDGDWPDSANDDLYNVSANLSYLSDNCVYDYGFDDWGKVGGDTGAPTTGDSWGSHDDVVWDDDDHKWEKASSE